MFVYSLAKPKNVPELVGAAYLLSGMILLCIYPAKTLRNLISRKSENIPCLQPGEHSRHSHFLPSTSINIINTFGLSWLKSLNVNYSRFVLNKTQKQNAHFDLVITYLNGIPKMLFKLELVPLRFKMRKT